MKPVGAIGRTSALAAWWLALGYFASYIFYSATVRALNGGLLSGQQERLSGLAILPGAVLATALTMTATIWMLGWWKYAGTRQVLGLTVPWPRVSTLISGLSFAVIIWTTTLAYSFPGISILLALLLMRGGVPILAPIVDQLSLRRIHWDAWTALALSFVALALAFSEVGGYYFTLAAGLNFAAYLAGYFFRLRQMTSHAKSEDATVNRRFFVEENMVAMLAIVALPSTLAAIGAGDAMTELRRGFVDVLGGPLTAPVLLVGFFYGILGVFGTLIYLDCRENTFCVVLNRGSSLLSGVVATYALVVLAGQPPVSARQLAGTALVLVAMSLLGISGLRGRAAPQTPALVLQRIVLFVCSGNTSRSPMAHAICNSVLAARLRTPLGAMGQAPVRAMSAGLTAKPGTPLSGHAESALSTLGISEFRHASVSLTAEMIAAADVVYCMTESQRLAVLELCPDAREKIHRLQPDGDIPDPSGASLDVFVDVARRLDRAVRQRLESFVPAPA
jgi:protein-tyrosine-phosphatase